MKKALLTLLISFLTLGAYAQDYKDSDYYYYDGIESYKGVTSEQRRKIISIKKSIGRRHAAIGKSGLRGEEKGRAHRKLNQEVRREIYEVLNSNQRDSWDKDRGHSSRDRDYLDKKWDKRDRSIEDRIDAIEDEIDRLEDYYDDLIDKVEDDDSLSKSVRKARKKQLKSEFEIKKRELKRQKQALKDSRY